MFREIPKVQRKGAVCVRDASKQSIEEKQKSNERVNRRNKEKRKNRKQKYGGKVYSIEKRTLAMSSIGIRFV